MTPARLAAVDRSLRLGTLGLVVVLALLSVAGQQALVFAVTPPLLAAAAAARLVVAGLGAGIRAPVTLPSLAEGLALAGLSYLTFTRDLGSPLLLVVVALLLAATFARRRLAEAADRAEGPADGDDAGMPGHDGT